MDPKIDEAFKHISQGRADAYEFCRTFYEFFHLFDDLIDRDKDVSVEQAVSGLLKFLAVSSTNLFFQEHKHQLFPVIHVGAMDYIASERLKKSEDVQSRLAAEVLKSSYQGIFFYVAFLIGGSSFALEADLKYRSYCFG